MQPSQTAELLEILLGAFPDAKIGPRTSEVYETMLSDLDFEVAKTAVFRLLATAKWLPKIADIREAAMDVMHGAVRRGVEAWGDVLSEIRRVGYMDTPTFTDPIVTACVERMGWRNLCLSEENAPDRARFVELYDALCGEERLALTAGSLPVPKLKQAPRDALQEAVRSGLEEFTRDLARRRHLELGAAVALAVQIGCRALLPRHTESTEELERKRLDALERMREFEAQHAQPEIQTFYPEDGI
jgi:hypothetical protein